MDAQRAAAAFGQHVEIAACLGGLDHAEASLLAGHRQIDRIGRGDLQEYAAVGPALVSLTGVSGGSATVFSNAVVNSRVLILAASTSGWLNGLMARIAPATAVAISNRKNS